MKIIVACDSFKDAVSSEEACASIALGILRCDAQTEVIQVPIADGGEGTARVLTRLSGGEEMTAEAEDALGRRKSCMWGLSGDRKTAFIDMAAASGLEALALGERDPLKTSTYGTGQLISKALSLGVEKVVLGIGGSATNDGGMGMARALGVEFLDSSGEMLSGTGEDLHRLDKIICSKRPIGKDTAVEVLCDVSNPLLGPEGAAHVFAGQKGANRDQIQQLEKGMTHFARIVQAFTGISAADVPGAGAAGGLGFGALSFLHADMRSGIDVILEYAQFDRHLMGADLVITGEGKLDHQTEKGKAIRGICLSAKSKGVPVVAFCGQLDLSIDQMRKMGLAGAFSISKGPEPLEEAIKKTRDRLSFNAEMVLNTILSAK